jgi:hypothetical protein
MKLTSLILFVGAITLSSLQVNAQVQSELPINMFQTIEPGIIKIIYGAEITEPITVKFRTKHGEVFSDKIKAGSFPKGVSKRYDVRRIAKKDYQIEISSSKFTSVYTVHADNDGNTFTPVFERGTQLQTVVATRN